MYSEYCAHYTTLHYNTCNHAGITKVLDTVKHIIMDSIEMDTRVFVLTYGLFLSMLYTKQGHAHLMPNREVFINVNYNDIIDNYRGRGGGEGRCRCAMERNGYVICKGYSFSKK